LYANRYLLLPTLLVLGVVLANLQGTPAGAGPGNYAEAGLHRPELEYLKAVNNVAPPQDPQFAVSAHGAVLEREPAG